MPIVVYRLLVIGVTTLAVLAPLSLVIYQSFLTAPFFDPSAQAGFLAYSFVFADPDFWQAFWTTIAIAGGMAAIAVPARRAPRFPDGAYRRPGTGIS